MQSNIICFSQLARHELADELADRHELADEVDQMSTAVYFCLRSARVSLASRPRSLIKCNDWRNREVTPSNRSIKLDTCLREAWA